MPVMIRVDDFPYTKQPEWKSGQHSIEKFREFDSIIPKKYLLGIIANHCRFENVWPDSDKVIPGVHGYWHDESRLNEFDGHSQNEICGYLVSASERIEGAVGKRPSVYMPPHNVIDSQTVIACSTAGFKAVTGGPGSAPWVKPCVNHYGMRYIESHPPYLYGRSDELMAGGGAGFLKTLQHFSDSCVLTLHWTWENNIGFDNLRSFMDQISDSIIDFDETKLS